MLGHKGSADAWCFGLAVLKGARCICSAGVASSFFTPAVQCGDSSAVVPVQWFLPLVLAVVLFSCLTVARPLAETASSQSGSVASSSAEERSVSHTHARPTRAASGGAASANARHARGLSVERGGRKLKVLEAAAEEDYRTTARLRREVARLDLLHDEVLRKLEASKDPGQRCASGRSSWLPSAAAFRHCVCSCVVPFPCLFGLPDFLHACLLACLNLLCLQVCPS